MEDGRRLARGEWRKADMKKPGEARASRQAPKRGHIVGVGLTGG